jgi:hypothetical protein
MRNQYIASVGNRPSEDSLAKSLVLSLLNTMSNSPSEISTPIEDTEEAWTENILCSTLKYMGYAIH